MNKNDRLKQLIGQAYDGVKVCKQEKCVGCKIKMLQALNVIEQLIINIDK